MLSQSSSVRHHHRNGRFDNKSKTSPFIKSKTSPFIDVNSIGCTFGDHYVIAWLVGKNAIIGFKPASAPMHEMDFISIRIAHEIGHRLSPAGNVETCILALHHQH